MIAVPAFIWTVDVKVSSHRSNAYCIMDFCNKLHEILPEIEDLARHQGSPEAEKVLLSTERFGSGPWRILPLK